MLTRRALLGGALSIAACRISTPNVSEWAPPDEEEDPMGRLILPRRPDAIAAIDPATLALEAFFHDYAGAPLLGRASAGGSGSRNATESTDPPALSALLGGLVGAAYDGVNDRLVLPGTAADYMAADGSFSGSILMKATAAGVYDLAEPYKNSGVCTDSSGSVGITYSPQGFGLFRNTDAIGWKQVNAAAPVGDVFYASFAFDAATSTLSVGINGPPTHSMFCRPIDISLAFRTLKLGENFLGTARATFQQWHFALQKTLRTPAEHRGVVRSLNARHGLALAQPSNVEPGFYAGTTSPVRTYVGTTKTTASGISQRDGAKLHFFAGKYRLLGGWKATPAAEWNNEYTTNEVWSSTDLINWTLDHPHTSDANARWSHRHTFGTAQPGDGYLYVIGADQYVSGRVDVWRTDGTSECGVWTRMTAAMPCGPRTGLCVGSYQGELHVLGGHPLEASAFYQAQPQHFRSVDGGATWEQLPDAPFSTAYITSLIEHDGLLIVTGGNGGAVLSGRVYQNAVWAWNGSAWRLQCAAAPWAGRMWVDTAVYDDKIWVIAGRDTDSTDKGDAWYSRDAGRTWTEVAAPWPPTHADGVCATVADGIVMVSGYGFGECAYTLKVAA